MSDQKTPQLVDIVRAQDTRIDYNFNTLIQTSIIVEYLLEKLQTLHPEGNWEEDFPAFQEERLKALEELAEDARKQLEGEDETTPSDLDSINL